MIEFRNVSKELNGSMVLEGIDLELADGTVAGLSGINGSGKTMLMRVLIGLIKPTEGHVLVDGKALWEDISFPESIGFLLENPSFIDSYTGMANLEMIASVRSVVDRQGIRKALERVGLDPDERKKYKKYSLGMKQRLGIAAAIMESPDIILLDEPTNSLDEDGVALVKRIIADERERGTTVLLSCHDGDILDEVSDVVYYLDKGRITKMEGKGLDPHA